MSSGSQVQELYDAVEEWSVIDAIKDHAKNLIAQGWILGHNTASGGSASGYEDYDNFSCCYSPESEKPMKPVPPMRAAVLDDAKTAVCQDRNADYGEPIDNFGRWAGACSALGYRRPGGGELKPHDMAVIAGLGKFCRTVESPEKADHWVDVAGYAATGYECVTLEG